MKYTISVQPAGVGFQSEENLLDDAISQHVPLEHSCRTGDCGVCSAEVISGSVENENGEVVNRGKVLTCQSKPLSDLVLQANYYPELVNIEVKTVPCKVNSFTLATDDIIVIKLRMPPTANFDYLPGQYIDLSFKGVKRSYSIANAKENGDELELHIRKVENGAMSDILFNQLKTNQLMRLEGPKGTFFVREDENPIIFMATGTGIAPVKAMVEKLIADGDKRKVDIYWGMQYLKEIYTSEFKALIAQHDNISLTPVLSRESSTSDEYYKGYVQHAVVDHFETLTNVTVYACGSLNMIEDAKNLLTSRGLPEESFHSDAFTPAK
ncbi:FAD-binding oxidoreductase [Vibrio maritimus]|uniref:FAD-binding oxidoreductase n=1 Tax=Vibrio maritimus TaxID=990268 RepID=UPI001F212D1D|nr:FAD-binding oxidoreductase [Vibrio maritimus]